MNFTIERAAFLTAAKRAVQLAPSASPLEVLKCALLEIDTGMRSLHMTATNMEVTLRQDVPLLAYEGGDTTFAIDAKLLSAMLANLPGNTVECCKGDKDTLALSSDHAYYQVPTASGKGFPRMNITAPESMVKLSGVPSMVRRAAFATDPNNSNMPLLRCVNLRLTSDGLRAVGSDGVCIVSAKGDKQCTGDQTFLIPAANLEKLAQLCEEKDTFSVGMADRQLVFVKEGFQFAARLMHGSYVDTDSLIAGTQNTFTVLSDSEELRRTLQTATAACMDNRTILHFDGNRLTLRCTGEVGSSNAALTVIPLTGQPFGDYCFAVDRLERCLRALRGRYAGHRPDGNADALHGGCVLYADTAPHDRVESKTAPQKSCKGCVRGRAIGDTPYLPILRRYCPPCAGRKRLRRFCRATGSEGRKAVSMSELQCQSRLSQGDDSSLG